MKKSSFFKSNIADLQPVKVGSKGSGGGKPQPGDHIIPDDDQDDDEQDDGDQDDGDIQDIPDVTIGGNPKPIVDIIPEGSSIEDMFGSDADILDGSDRPGGQPISKEELKKKAEQADKNAKLGKDQGDSPGGTKPGKGLGDRRIVSPDLFPVKTDWAAILINLLKTKKPAGQTWSKPHKRTFGMKIGGKPVMRPGRSFKPDIGKIVLAMDTSGSISNQIISGFLSDIKRIFTTFVGSETFGVRIILWSDGPYAESQEFKINEFSKLQQWVMSNVKSGGTAISRVVDTINSIPNLKTQYVATVWFTDGEVWDLDKPLPDMDNVFVIQGYNSEYTRRFFADVQKFRPKGKEIKVVRANY